jgi:hypothetical protein
VAQYSDPFFDLGAAGYYANWFGDAFQMFVRYLFQGQTLGQAYESYFDFNPDTVDLGTHPDHPSKAMWLDKDYWGYWQYNNAFAGLPDQTLNDLFAASMEISPAELTYIALPSYPSRPFTVTVTGTDPDPFGWQAFLPPDAPWMTAFPLSGTSGESITVVISPMGMTYGLYETGLQVVADDPEIHQGDQTVPITLSVVDQIRSLFMPVVSR